MKDGFVTFTAKIDASLKNEEEQKQDKFYKDIRTVSSQCVGMVGTIVGGFALAIAAAPVTAGASLAWGLGVPLSSVLAGGVGFYISESIESDNWKKRTDKRKHTAQEGHVIFTYPKYEETGNGCVRILNWDEKSFDYEITAFQGEFTVKFTSNERWMHRAATGDFTYLKSIDQYKADLRDIID